MGHFTRETIAGCPRGGCDTTNCRVAQLPIAFNPRKFDKFEKTGISVSSDPKKGGHFLVQVCSGMLDDSITTTELTKAGVYYDAHYEVGSYENNCLENVNRFGRNKMSEILPEGLINKTAEVL